MTTFQIATFGPFRQDSILTGLRKHPSQKLALICYEQDKTKAKFFTKKIRLIDRNIEIIIRLTRKQNVIENVFENISKVVRPDIKNFQQILINVSSGNKLLSYAVLCAACVIGIKTFIINSKYSSTPVIIPVLKLPYHKIITETDVRILNSIESAGGEVYGLDQLQRISGLVKPLLSYHICARNNTKGLIDLGLVTTEHKQKSSIVIFKITAIGKLFVTNDTSS